MKKVSDFVRIALGYPVDNGRELVQPSLTKEDLKRVKPLEVDVCDNLLRRSPDTINMKSDIWLLTHQEQLTFDSANAIANALQVRFAQRPEKSLYAGMTDKEILDTIKPRQIQTQSELDSWLVYLDSLEQSVEVDKLVEVEKPVEVENSVDKPVESGS